MFLYEDGQFVPLAQYINSSDGQAELLSSRGWQVELAEETQAAPKLYHYVCDHLGTPQLLMNQGQEVVWEAKAKAWGETRVMSRAATDEQVINNHRFQGQYYDAETSLHYNTFRYYDPELGRFISQDPIGLMGGINLYQYAPNPVEWVDPLGLKTNSALLGRNLGASPGLNHDAHHIIMTGTKDPKMNALVEQMKRHGIDPDGKLNGIWLARTDADKIPGISAGTTHKQDGLHGNAYKNEIFNRLNGKNKEEFKSELKKIKEELKEGRTWETRTTQKLGKVCR